MPLSPELKVELKERGAPEKDCVPLWTGRGWCSGLREQRDFLRERNEEGVYK